MKGSSDQVLRDLLLRWEELQEQGQALSPEELCRDCPELLEPLKQRIAALRAMDSVLETGESGSAGTADDAGRTAAEAAGPAESQPVSPPDYEILGELGRGGMGVVYKARQISLNRLVALKMILSAEHAGKMQLARFCAEAEAVAQLQHPNIVTIYEVGAHEDRPFIALELVDGGSLEDKLAGVPQPPRQAALVVETLARAMHYAHQRGIVHRDLKPGNILLQIDERGMMNNERKKVENADSPFITQHSSFIIPKITDFGLAKRLGPGMTITRMGTVLGTPCYMAPEQAAGNIGQFPTGIDIYALGAMLYEMLTGRPPFQGSTNMETLHMVMNAEPVPPRRLQPSASGDLETICLKCLEKEPGKRYATAGALADDLRRFLNGEPILARPTPAWERGLKWARRRPALASLLAVSLLALVMGLWYHVRLYDALRDARDQHAEAEKRLVYLHIANAVYLQDSENLFMSLTWLAEALRMEPDAEARASHRIRIGTTLRLCPRIGQLWFHEREVNHAAFSPDGLQVVTASNDSTARVWESSRGRLLDPVLMHGGPVLYAQFSPDNRRIVTASADGTARVWDSSTHKQRGRAMKHKDAVLRAVFSPDSRWVATASADHTAQIWDAASGERRFPTSLQHQGPVRDVAFSPDGNWLLTAAADRTAQIWDAASGKPRLAKPLQHKGPVGCAAFSPDGKHVATGSDDMEARLWEADTGAAVWPTPARHQGPVLTVAFSPAGQPRLVTASTDQTARVWDLDSGKQTIPALYHLSSVYGAAFSRDGERIATCSDDNTARAWNANTGRPITPHLTHNASVKSAVFSPDPAGRWLLTASDDHCARLFEVEPRDTVLPEFKHPGAILSVRYGPASRERERPEASAGCIVTAGEDGTARIWQAATGKLVGTPLRHQGAVREANFSSDGQWVVTASDDRTAQVWEAATGQKRFPSPLQHEGAVWRASFSPDNKYVVSASDDQTARVWNAATGATVAVLPHGGPVRDAGFSPDGRWVVTASDDQTARLWEADSGKEVGPPMKHDLGVLRARFSPDGKAVLTASKDQTAQLWQAGTGKALLSEPLHHAGKVLDAGFDPSGRWIVTASDDNTARIWQAETGKLLVPPLRHNGAVHRAAFTRRAHAATLASRAHAATLASCWVVTASNDNTARVWDAQTGAPLTPPLTHQGMGRITDADFAPDGNFVATASAYGTARQWDLRPSDLAMDDLPRLAQLYSGGEIDRKTLGLVPLRPDALKRVWQELRGQAGPN